MGGGEEKKFSYVNIRNNMDGANKNKIDTLNAQMALLVINLPPQKNNVFPIYNW